MLEIAGRHSYQIAERIEPLLRFECWTVERAEQLGADPASIDGYVAGFAGAPCPGPAHSDAYRLGWEVGAIHARRVPVPAWMVACNAQADSGCLPSA
jgi:hypothetical protein